MIFHRLVGLSRNLALRQNNRNFSINRRLEPNELIPFRRKFLKKTLNEKIGVSYYHNSPLCEAFHSEALSLANYNIFASNKGLFNYEELTAPYGFRKMHDNALKEVERLVEECSSERRSRKMVQIFDDLSNVLCKVADMAEFIRTAHPKEEYRKEAERACVSLSNVVESLNTNTEIYNALKNVLENGDVEPLTESEKYVCQLFIFDFEQSGIHLDKEKRNRVFELTDTILRTGHEYLENTNKPIVTIKRKYPLFVQRHFEHDNEFMTILDLKTSNELEVVREVAYKEYLQEIPDQEQRLLTILKSRHELANVCGFESFAHRATRGCLAESPELVNNFLSKLSVKLKPLLEDEMDLLHVIKNELNYTSPGVHLWDMNFLINAGRTQKIDGDLAADMQKYFTLGMIVAGVNKLYSSLMGVTLKLEPAERGELWHGSVHKLVVYDEIEDIPLGIIYCDLFARDGKPRQDCHYTIKGGKQLSDDTYQHPVVVLHMNIKGGAGPYEIDLSLAENIFHEFGHALHSMIARTKFQHVTGTRCCTDFAEIPSILMEFFFSDYRVLHFIGRHHETGEHLPEESIDEIINARDIFSASDTNLQVFYAALDQNLHRTNFWDHNKSTTDVLAETQDEFYHLPYVPNTALQHRFGHLIGYGARYYSYLMSRAVASWIWQKYFKDDPFSREMGLKYKNEFLRHGGSKPPQQIVGDYLEKEITPDNLVDALVTDLTNKSKSLNEFPLIIL